MIYIQIWEGPHSWIEVAVIPLGIVTIKKIVKKGGNQASKKFYKG